MPATNAETPEKLVTETNAEPVKSGIGNKPLIVATPTHVLAYQKGKYLDGVLALADEMEPLFKETIAPTAKIDDISADAAQKCLPFRQQQAIIMLKIANIVAELRRKFTWKKSKHGRAEPGSWPHLCRKVLAPKGYTDADEKGASRQKRAIEYIERHHAEIAKALKENGVLNVPAVPSVGDCVALARIKKEDEKVRADLDAKVFSGELGGRELLEAIPKKGGGGGGKRMPYSPGDHGDGSLAKLKLHICDLTAGEEARIAVAKAAKNDAEGDADAIKNALENTKGSAPFTYIYVGGQCKGSKVETNVKAAIEQEDLGSAEDVCWMVWRKA